jgi:hypothetical protein
MLTRRAAYLGLPVVVSSAHGLEEAGEPPEVTYSRNSSIGSIIPADASIRWEQE